MTIWVKQVPVNELVDDQHYFFARAWESMGSTSYSFWSRGLNGKPMWSVKPGIAMHIKCDEKFRKALADTPGAVAVAIPADYATRWKARTKRFT